MVSMKLNRRGISEVGAATCQDVIRKGDYQMLSRLGGALPAHSDSSVLPLGTGQILPEMRSY